MQKAIAHRDEAAALIASNQADVDNAKIDLGYTTITAPFTGRIQQTRINVGQLVMQQQDVLTTLVEVDPSYVIFNISRTQSFSIQKLKRAGLGMQKLDQVKATIKLADGSTYSHEGVLDYVSAKVDSSTDTVEARAVFPNPQEEGHDADLIAGQYVPLTMVVGRRPKTLLTPQPAPVQSQAGMHVYALGKNGTVEHRAVQIGTAYQHQWVIEKGLHPGEQVLVEGLQKVRPGMRVVAERIASTQTPKQP